MKKLYLRVQKKDCREGECRRERARCIAGRDGEREREAINDLNNNAALCIHRHTLALDRHHGRLSESRPSICSVASSSFLSHSPWCASLSLSLTLCYRRHHVTIKSLPLNLPCNRYMFSLVCSPVYVFSSVPKYVPRFDLSATRACVLEKEKSVRGFQATRSAFMAMSADFVAKCPFKTKGGKAPPPPN